MAVVRDQGLPEVVAEVDAVLTAENGLRYHVFAGQPVPPTLVELYRAAQPSQPESKVRYVPDPTEPAEDE